MEQPNFRLIQAGKIYSGKRAIEALVFKRIGSYIKLCDPYCGTKTLDIIGNIPHKCEIFLLTQNIDKKENFKRDLADFEKEFRDLKIQIKVFSSKVLHDRYLITNDYCWSIGASLKDFGNKDTSISQNGRRG